MTPHIHTNTCTHTKHADTHSHYTYVYLLLNLCGGKFSHNVGFYCVSLVKPLRRKVFPQCRVLLCISCYDLCGGKFSHNVGFYCVSLVKTSVQESFFCFHHCDYYHLFPDPLIHLHKFELVWSSFNWFEWNFDNSRYDFFFLAYLSPEGLALGTAMVTSKKRKRDIIDDCYNRYACQLWCSLRLTRLWSIDLLRI